MENNKVKINIPKEDIFPKIMVFTVKSDSDDPEDLFYEIIFNNTGRESVIWDDDNSQFSLSGDSIYNYIPTITQEYNATLPFYSKASILNGAVGVYIDGGVPAINLVTTLSAPLTVKIEIYE
jgi:hypothetical protein